MQLLAILIATVLVFAGIILTGRHGLFDRALTPGRPAPGRRVTPRRPESARAGDTEFAEELAPPTGPFGEPSPHDLSARELSARESYEPEYAAPSRYGDNTVVLMARDPEWLYAYWEVQPEDAQQAAWREGVDLSGSSPVLRLYDVTEGEAYGREAAFRDIVLSEYADRWFLSAMTPAREYYAEIGRLTRSGKFISFARSNRVTTPPAGVSPVMSPDWPPLAWPERHGAGAVSSLEFPRSALRK